jgi:large subunit ribosomal protein L17
LGTRTGDNAEIAMIELVDFNEVYGKGTAKAAETVKKTRRSGGSKKKAATQDAAAPAESEQADTEKKDN